MLPFFINNRNLRHHDTQIIRQALIIVAIKNRALSIFELV